MSNSSSDRLLFLLSDLFLFQTASKNSKIVHYFYVGERSELYRRATVQVPWGLRFKDARFKAAQWELRSEEARFEAAQWGLRFEEA